MTWRCNDESTLPSWYVLPRDVVCVWEREEDSFSVQYAELEVLLFLPTCMYATFSLRMIDSTTMLMMTKTTMN